MFIRESDYPDTSISFYNKNGILVLKHMAHACLLSRAVAIKNLIDSPGRRRSSSAESHAEMFGKQRAAKIACDVHQVRIDIGGSHVSEECVVDALRTFVRCFYVDLSPEKIDQHILDKITRHLVLLHDMGSRYGFADLVSVCEDVAARCMTRELCEGLLEHFIDVYTGSIKLTGVPIVSTAVTWARQCTSGYRWRTQLLSYLERVLPEHIMRPCDPTHPDPSRLVIRKCDDCWTVKDSPFPCLIANKTFLSSPLSRRALTDVTIVWKKRRDGNHAISIRTPCGGSSSSMLQVSDFFKSGTWNSCAQIIKGENQTITLPSHESDRLFYAECMCCKTRAPCYIYCLDFISDETETSSMDCD